MEKEKNEEKNWMILKKRLDSLPDPYKCAFEKFVVGIGKIAEENKLQSISNIMLRAAQKEYRKTNNNVWKEMTDKFKAIKDYGVSKDTLKRCMTRPLENGEYLDFLSDFFNMDKGEVVNGLAFRKRQDEFLDREIKYLVGSELVEKRKKELDKELVEEMGEQWKELEKKLEEEREELKRELEEKEHELEGKEKGEKSNKLEKRIMELRKKINMLDRKIKKIKERKQLEKVNENFERLVNQQNDVKSRFISLDARTQKAVILLVQEISVLLYTEE